MLTLKITKYEEPKPSYAVTTYSANDTKVTFTAEEIEEAQKTALLCGFEPGLMLEHTPTKHTIKILGFNTAKHIHGYRNKPMVLLGERTRQNHVWESTFTVDELLDKDYVIIVPPNEATA